VTDEDAALEQKLAALRETFRASLSARMSEIEDAMRAVAAARSMNDCRVAIGNLQALSHKMVGAAGTFGFAPIGDAAREVEEFCAPLLDVVEPPGEEARHRIDSLVDALGRAVADGLAAQED
jgi:HPt (histidine-containing phosphotransfer) domain-containing protein